MTEYIPVYKPELGIKEWENVRECLETTWISSRGRFVEEFEEAFAQYTGVKHGIAVCNGTVALHLALAGLGIGAGDKVAVPTFTYIAAVNAIRYVGAEPVFVDSDPTNLQMSPADLAAKATEERLRAVIAVHLYGHPSDMSAIAAVARARELLLIEDCAEAFGARIGERHVGGYGQAATYSFFGNKTITTGEGGMVTANDDRLALHFRKLRGQGLAKDREYWHDTLGFNFRMTNICAGIGVAQLQNAAGVLAKKRAIAGFYQTSLQGTALTFHTESLGTTHSFWMCSVLTRSPKERDELRAHLKARKIETRPFFYPVHQMPMYSAWSRGPYPGAEDAASRGINLPSYPGLTSSQLERVRDCLVEYYRDRAT